MNEFNLILCIVCGFAVLWLCYLNFNWFVKTGRITNEDNLLITLHAFGTVGLVSMCPVLFLYFKLL